MLKLWREAAMNQSKHALFTLQVNLSETWAGYCSAVNDKPRLRRLWFVLTAPDVLKRLHSDIIIHAPLWLTFSSPCSSCWM